MRIASLLFVATLVSALSTSAHAADPKIWVGHYPSDNVAGTSFWRNLGGKLDATVGPQLAALIRRGAWGPEVPVEHHEGWTIVWVCKAHECGDNNVAILVNAAGRVVACIKRVDEKPPIRWQEIGKPVVPLDHDCKDGEHLVDDMVWSGIWKR